MNMLAKFKPSKWWLVLLIPIFVCFLCWLAFIFLLEPPYSPCRKEPCSISEIQSRLPTWYPLYIPKMDSPYSDLTLTFYYSDIDDPRLWTILGSTQRGGRVARMVTTPRLEPLDTMTTTHGQPVIVTWARESKANKYELLPEYINNSRDPGVPYQTYIVWMIENSGIYFHIYSALPLDETLVLINSLEEVKR
jgi:hypothetical protein